MTDKLKEAIEVLKQHKSTTDKFNHTVGNVKVSEAIDTVVSEICEHHWLPIGEWDGVMKLQKSIDKLKEIREVAKTYGVVTISEGDSRAIDTVLAAFPQSRQMTAKEYIIKEYGEPWLKNDWSSGDVIDIMEDYAKYRIEEEERLFRERIESDAELWGRVGAKPPINDLRKEETK